MKKPMVRKTVQHSYRYYGLGFLVRLELSRSLNNIMNDHKRNGYVFEQLRADFSNLSVIEDAIDYAITEEDLKLIVAFAERLVKSYIHTQESSELRHFMTTIAQCDPAIFFNFCCKRSVDKYNFTAFYRQLKKNMREAMSHQNCVIDELCLTVALKVMGSTNSPTPLLVGGPGVGRSIIAYALADAITAAGCHTGVISKSLAQQSNKKTSKFLLMDLLGTDSHYSNSEPGEILASARSKNNEFIILVLDDVDKGNHRDALMGLLDPNNPLDDSFASYFVQGMDMKRKVIPILTANDLQSIDLAHDDPLWSYLEVMEVAPMNRHENSRHT